VKHRAATASRRRVAVLAVAALGALVVAWNVSEAAFFGRSPTGASPVTAGTVTLGNSPATGVLNVAGMVPGSFGSTCITTTYTGTLPADVRIYLRASDLTGTLGPYLTLQIREGTGSDAACGDFVSAATLYNTTGLADTSKTVTAFSAAARDYATGVSRWRANPGATRTYQFSWQMQDDNAARSATAGIAFRWEAQGV
jgi:hypothetical protein